MSLAVLGGQSLDELQQWVQELFGILASGPGPSPSFAHAGLPFQVVLVVVVLLLLEIHS